MVRWPLYGRVCLLIIKIPLRRLDMTNLLRFGTNLLRRVRRLILMEVLSLRRILTSRLSVCLLVRRSVTMVSRASLVTPMWILGLVSLSLLRIGSWHLRNGKSLLRLARPSRNLPVRWLTRLSRNLRVVTPVLRVLAYGTRSTRRS